MAGEEFAIGVGGSLVAAVLLRAGDVTRERLHEAFQKEEYPAELDEVETAFVDALEESIADLDSKRDTGELAGVAERWESVVRELYGLDEEADEDGVDRILFISEGEAVNEITGAIARSAGFDISKPPQREIDLKVAVAKAYRDAIDVFAENVGESVTNQFFAESEIELHKRLREAQQTLSELHERLSRRRYDLHPGNEAGRMQVAEKLERREFGRPEDAQIDYVPRPELDEIDPDESVLLLGPGGSGKSRSLIELIRYHEDVAHTVYPREAFENPSDAHEFAMETFDGDVLLVWDNIHRANPEDDNKVVRKAIVELRDILAPDHDLHVLATARLDEPDRIPGFQAADDDLWRDVTPVGLSDTPREVLEDIIDNAADAFEVTVEEDVRDAFLAKVRRAEPTPFYVRSVLENAGSELTETDVEEIPESALEIWEENYDRLDEKPKDVLRSMKILSDLAPGSVFPEPLVRGVYSEVFDGSEPGFDGPLGTVLNRHWLIQVETDGEYAYGMHDVKRAAVKQDFERWLVDRLSEFLDDGPERCFDTIRTSTIRVLHGNFAGRVKEFEWGVETAKKHYNHILEHIDEDDAVTYSNLGLLLDEEGETAEAKRRYEQAIDADPEYAKAYSNLGLLLKAEGETAEAKRRFEQAIDADPEHAKAHANYGFLLLNDSAFGPAIDRLESSTRLWISEGNLGNALNDMSVLARAQFDSGNQLRGLETCVTAIGIASNTNLPEESVDWGWAYLVNRAVDNPETSLRLASASAISRNPTASYILFRVLWEDNERINDDHGRIAGVATAAFHDLNDSEDDPPEVILSDIDPATLCDPVRAVYEYVLDGESDRAVDEEPSVPAYVPYPFEADEDERRIEDVPLDLLVRDAFNAILFHLQD